tara:strand:- start:38546 stop:39313 length:768 start_codon:yes stop_codon:yes gene_type:complete
MSSSPDPPGDVPVIPSLEGDEPLEAEPGEPREEAEGLYPGDHGGLPLEARRVLVKLLSGPVLDAHRHGQLWPVLLREEARLRVRLSELFLTLVVDSEQEVAFVRQADTGELEAPCLLRSTRLTLIDSALLLHLRQQLMEAARHGERAVVELDDLHEQLAPFRRQDSTDAFGHRKRVDAAIEKAKKNSILRKLRGSDSRFEVSPILKLLFSAEEIGALSREYQKLAEGGFDAPSAEDAWEERSEDDGDDDEEAAWS